MQIESPDKMIMVAALLNTFDYPTQFVYAEVCQLHFDRLPQFSTPNITVCIAKMFDRNKLKDKTRYIPETIFCHRYSSFYLNIPIRL